MIDIDQLYFSWLMEDRLRRTDDSFTRLCLMLHQNVFQRRVGNDINRSVDGENLRRAFLFDYSEANIEPSLSNDLIALDCSWLEMLVALSEALDYLYDGGVVERFLETIGNLGLSKVLKTSQHNFLALSEVDQELVDIKTAVVDQNLFDANGLGGMFPLHKHDHPDQREVEIWEQAGAYFRERLEGVMWTSTH